MIRKKGGKYLEFSIIERKILLFIVDNIIVFLCVSSLLDSGEPLLQKIHYIAKIGPYMYSLILFIIISPFVGFYNRDYISKTKVIIPISVILGIIYSLIFLVTPIIVPRLDFGKSQIIFFILSVPFFLSLWRVFFSKFILSNMFYKNILLITEDNFSYSLDDIESMMSGNKNQNGYIVKNRLNINNYKSNHLERIKKLVEKSAYNLVVVAVSDHKDINKDVNNFLLGCLKRDLPIQSFYKVYESIFEAMPLKIAGNRFYDVFPINRSNYNLLYKLFTKIIDLLFSFSIGIFLLIIIPFVWFLNLFFNKGPLFYSQKRIGKGGKEFSIYKFRSMLPHNENDHSMYVQKNDTRLTLFGKILRKLRVDELPQIYNVLKGDMSLIGPRAEWNNLGNNYQEKIPFYESRYSIKPGITGWAQVNYKYGENLEDSIRKLEYDLFYIKNRSVYIDIRILFRTVNTILFSKGQ